MLWGNPGPGDFIFAVVSALGLLLLLVGRKLWVLGHGMCGILLSSVVILSAANGGGLGAASMMMAPLVPTLAFFVSGSRAGGLWFVLVILSAVGLYAAEPLIGDPRLAPELAPWTHFLATCVSTMCITGFIWQYDRMARAQAAELETACQQAEAAARARADFLATMSHEIRTPLGGIFSAAQLLHGTDSDAQREELVGVIDQSAQGLLALLNQVLDHARLEAGGVTLERVPFQPAAVAREVMRLHSPSATEKGIGLSLRAGEAGWVLGDPLRFQQVVGNLLNNAIKFTDTGEIRLCVTVRGGGLQLVVADTGIGMTAAQQERLFEPFRQADEGIARRFGGSGLGMSIVKQLVGAMAGRISVVSAQGEGSTFTIDLPLLPTEAPPPVEVASTFAPLGLRVMVVDDNPINRRMFSLMLERMGCAVSLAEDGREALHRAPQEQPDVILMDIHMPGMDGIETAQRLRGGGAWRIFALTASVTDDVRVSARAAGMEGFLSKPLALAALHATLAPVSRASA